MLDKYQSETARNMQRWDREDAYQRTVERNLHLRDDSITVPGPLERKRDAVAESAGDAT